MAYNPDNGLSDTQSRSRAERVASSARLSIGHALTVVGLLITILLASLAGLSRMNAAQVETNNKLTRLEGSVEIKTAAVREAVRIEVNGKLDDIAKGQHAQELMIRDNAHRIVDLGEDIMAIQAGLNEAKIEAGKVKEVLEKIYLQTIRRED